MYFLWTGRFHIVFWSECLDIFSELLHCTFFLLCRTHNLFCSAKNNLLQQNNLLQVHFWTQDLDFSFCLSFGVLLTTNIKAPSSFLGNIIISTAWWKYPDDIRHPSCCWRGYLCIPQLVFWRKWGNLITIPIVSASHQSLFLSWPLDKKGRSDQVASKTRVALNKNGIFGILAHPWDH